MSGATTPTDPVTPPEPSPAPETPTAPTPAPPETDWKAEARKWESRSKDNKAELDSLAEKFSALEAQNGELVGKVTAFESEREHAQLVAKIAEAEGVPAVALRGTTEEELTAHAASLKEAFKPSAPVIPGQAKIPGAPLADPNREAVKKLFGNN